MKLFLKKFSFLVFIGFGLLCMAAPAQAQKWKALKKALFPPQVQVKTIAWQTQLERAIHRATMQSPKLPYSPQVEIRKGVYHFVTPIDLLPPAETFRYTNPLPPFPLPDKENEMYRGMVLDQNGDELRHILKNGLEVSKSHYENFISYNGLDYPDGTKAIYAATTTRQAMPFIIPDIGLVRLPVLLHLKRVGWRSIVSVPHDIPPSWILRVSALLNIEGTPRWGELKLNKDGSFSFFPYPENPPASPLP